MVLALELGNVAEHHSLRGRVGAYIAKSDLAEDGMGVHLDEQDAVNALFACKLRSAIVCAQKMQCRQGDQDASTHAMPGF